jgi:transcriptional regulator with AAA-type ATPase domain
MSRTKRTPSLTRLFDQCPDPIYVIDGRQRIVYVNAALTEWIGVPKEELIGRIVEYHSHDDRTFSPGIVEGLCPPPTAMVGQATWGHVYRTADDNTVAYRLGHFLPLGHSNGLAPLQEVAAEGPLASEEGPTRRVGVVGVLQSRDLTPSEVDAGTGDEPTFQDLHRAVHQMRKRRAIRGAGVALVGESEPMRRARRQVELAALTRTPTLAVGSDAWQRRRVAEAIAYIRQDDKDEAVFPLDCHLLDENLLQWSLESVSDRGRQRVTLLFHDLHQLPVAAQPFLAERMPRWPATWRVIATCDAASGGDVPLAHLDARLVHWLSTLVIDLPPLSARTDDLPLVIQYLLEEVNSMSKKQLAGFSPAALDRAQLFDWPGGLEQLRAVVTAAHTAAGAAEIAIGDLPPLLIHSESAAAYPRNDLEPIALEELLASIETGLIRRALELSEGNKTQAATLLGMTRPRLYRRLEQLGLL